MKILILSVSFILSIGYVHADILPNHPKEKEAIISQCRSLMGQFGAFMVKSCVDQNIEAFKTLQAYPPQHQALIKRCTTQMKSLGGWFIVKSCVDHDIEAEEALKNY